MAFTSLKTLKILGILKLMYKFFFIALISQIAKTFLILKESQFGNFNEFGILGKKRKIIMENILEKRRTKINEHKNFQLFI